MAKIRRRYPKGAIPVTLGEWVTVILFYLFWIGFVLLVGTCMH